MANAQVALVRQSDYVLPKIRQSVNECLGLLGGLEKILKPRSKVFIKINHLSPASAPERGIISHPAITREILLCLKDWQSEVTVGDDIQSSKEDGFLVSGYRQLCQELGVRLVNLKEAGFREVRLDGQVLKTTYISPLVLDADVIINISKLKTHSYTIFTGAIKNMFGIIPYGLRLQYHRQYFRNEVFSRMLVDILSAAPPHLNVMDGVVAMEGEGPAAGHLRSVGALLASRDAVALDAVATKIAGFNPLDVYTTRNGWERGLGEARLTHIQVLGAPLRSVETRDFEHSAIASHLFRSRLPSIFYAYFEGQMVLTPEVRQEKCTSCGECVRTCPTGASRLTKRNAWIDKRQCIHCMCCHEVCRDNAIRLRQRPFGWIFRKSAALSRWI